MIRNLVVCFLVFLPFALMAGNEKLVSDSFVVPVEKKFHQYSFVKVNPQFSKMDFEALVSAKEFIREELGTDWPADNFTVKENTDSLIHDLKAFNNKENFTFHIFDIDRSKIIGCFYISQTSDQKYDAAVFVWVRKQHLKTPYFKEIKENVRIWVDNSWPFSNVDYSLNKT